MEMRFATVKKPEHISIVSEFAELLQCERVRFEGTERARVRY